VEELILFDTETTDLSDDRRAIQFGAMVKECDEGCDLIKEIIDEFADSGREISLASKGVTFIDEDDVAGFPPLSENRKVMQMLADRNKEDSFVAAHNAPFDIKVMENEKFSIKSKVIDTLVCAQHLIEEIDDYKLGTLFFYFGGSKKLLIEKYSPIVGKTLGTHDAISDVCLLDHVLSGIRSKFSLSLNAWPHYQKR